MKKTFSRSLVGAAVLLACGQAYAATVSVTPTFSSVERNASDAAANGASSVALPTATVTPSGTGYVDGDIVTVSVSGATLRLASVGVVDTSKITCTDTGGGAAPMELLLKSVTGGTITYQVTRLVTATPLSQVRCAVSGLQVLASSLTSANVVTFNWSAATAAGVAHDVLRSFSDEGSPASAISLHYADTQFAATGVSTNAARILPLGSSTSYAAQQRFASTSTAAATAATTQDFSINFTSNGTLPGQSLLSTAGSTLTATYTGDFSFLDNNGNGCTAADLTTGWARAAVTAGGGTLSINSACTVLTTTGAGDRNETIRFSVANTSGDGIIAAGFSSSIGAKTLPAQTLAVVGTWTAADNTVLGSARPSSSTTPSFTVNAFTTEIPYMPYGSGISRIVYITNRSSTAPVSFSAVNEAGTSCAASRFPAVSARGGAAVTLLSTAIDQGIEACYGAGFTGKVRITVTLNITPQSTDSLATTLSTGATSVGASTSLSGAITRARAAADVYSAYNVNGNRVTVINESNGR
jgi:hypothetical protein